MPEVTKYSSGGVYEKRHNYSRVVTVDNWIFMSVSAGFDPLTGNFPDDPVEQSKFLIQNIERSLAQAGATLADVVRYRSFVPNREDIFPVMDYVTSHFKGIDPACALLCTPLGSDDYKVEIEITAYKGVGAADQKRVSFSLAEGLE